MIVRLLRLSNNVKLVAITTWRATLVGLVKFVEGFKGQGVVRHRMRNISTKPGAEAVRL
jgi:hypothetical protein